MAAPSAAALFMTTLVLVASLSTASARATSPGPAATAQSTLAQPEDVAYDAAGTLYVSEFAGNVVDRVGPGGTLTVVAGTGVPGYSGSSGLATETQLNAPAGLTFASDGSLLIADHHNDCIRRLAPTMTISTVAGICTKHGTQGDGGAAIAAK